MANNLTGDYDVVVQISTGAANRIAAALHATERFPHSFSLAVDDRPTSSATAVAVVDASGGAVEEAGLVKRTALQSAKEEFRQQRGKTQYSDLSGVAQLQLGAPAVELIAGKSTSATIRFPTRIQYFPDPGTRPVSRFLNGEIAAGFGVRSVTNPNGGTEIAVAINAAAVSFAPSWSETALSAADQNAINLALSKTVSGSFLPSTTPVPPSLRKLDLKAFPPGVIGMMLNVVTNNNALPSGVQNIFMAGSDDFALAISGSVLTQQFADAVNRAIDPSRVTDLDNQFDINYGLGTYTFHIYTRISIGTATVSLVELPAGIPNLTGLIQLTVPVSVTFGWANKPFFIPDPVDFNFSVRQSFILSVNGTQVSIQRAGGVSVDLPNNIVVGIEALLGDIKGRAETLFNNAWAANESQIQQTVAGALSLEHFQSFLGPLLTPPGTGATASIVPTLAYSSCDIRGAGIVFHGSLSFPAFSPPQVAFTGSALANPTTPEYRALNSWVPGGAIDSFSWSFAGASRPPDSGRFVTIDAPSGVSPICLTISGSRLSAAGPIVQENVIAGRCELIRIYGVGPVHPGRGMNAPSVSLVRQKGRGLEFVGQTSPWSDPANPGPSANMLVHFPGKASLKKIEQLPIALGKSARTDTATSIVCVLTKEQIASAPFIPGVIYSDDASWEKRLQVKQRPSLVLLSPTGEIIWRHERDMDTLPLSNVLRQKLVHRAQGYIAIASTRIRAGDRPPAFAFDYGGRKMGLHKLAGAPIALLFDDDSASSREALRDVRRLFSAPGIAGPAIVVIHRGKRSKHDCASVVDSDGSIAQAYGVQQWPTIVFLNPDGSVRDVRFGRIAEAELSVPVKTKAVSSRKPAAKER